MKRLSKLLASLLIGALAVPAMAHGGCGHGGHGGYGHGSYRHGGYAHGGYGGGFRGGYEFRQGWGNNWVAPVIGATILGGAIYAANRPFYVVQQQPILNAPPQGAYFCSAYQQFYPNVPTCPVPWQIVPYN